MSKDYRTLRVTYQPSLPDRPKLVIQGRWLKRLNFNPGEIVEISTTFPEVIVISKQIDTETLPKLGEFFSDYLKLDEDTVQKDKATPQTEVVVKLIGKDVDAFEIITTVSDALNSAGYKDLADKYTEEATDKCDIDKLLSITTTYVTVE